MKFLTSRWLPLAVGILLLFLSSASVVLRTSAHLASHPSVMPEESCKCADLPALISRRREVNAAIAAIDKQMERLAADEQKLGKAIGYSDRDYSLYFSNWVQLAIDNAHDKSSAKVNGPTKFTIDCTPTTSSSDNPSCFWQGLAMNEAVRQKFCESRTRSQTVLGSSPGDWRSPYPLGNFAAVEKSGYEAERTYLKQQIQRLLATCKFSKWSGEVTVHFGIENKWTKSLPPPGTPSIPHQEHGSESFQSKEFEDVTITLVDGRAMADGTADYYKHDQTQKGDEIWCHASTRPDKAFVPWSRTEISEYNISGPAYSGSDVHVSFANDGTYTITAQLPSGEGIGTSSVDNTETGECAMKPLKNSLAAHNRVGGFTAKGKGQGKDTDLVLDGTYAPPAETSTLGTIIRTTAVSIRWHLTRTRPN
jgi:hypothetical protein